LDLDPGKNPGPEKIQVEKGLDPGLVSGFFYLNKNQLNIIEK
jgi:hypothetical protein